MAISRLKVFLLGPPQVKVDNTPVEMKRRKVMALLAYLAVTGDVQRRDTLAMLLWPDSTQRNARAALRRHLWELNKLLGGDWLQADRENVSPRVGTDFWLDVAQFQACLAACRKHGHPEGELCPDCLPLLSEAVALYRADFLSGFSLSGSPDFDEWQYFQAESLRQDLASVLERLARGYSDQGEPKTAIPYARRWLALDPLQETAHRYLMQFYAQTGDRTAALRQYQTCLEVLETELGVPPSEDTTALYERIREGELSRGAGEQGSKRDETPALPTPPHTSAPRHNLPAQTIPLVGREHELVGLARLLDQPDIRLVTILGAGGMGKTRLALEAAATQVDRYQNGVFFVPLAPLGDPETMVSAIAGAVGYSFQADQRPPKQQLLDYFRQKELLLVLDSFEHLLAPPLSPSEVGMKGGAELVAEVLQAGPGVRMLVTSRERLRLSGEMVFPLEGMDYPQGETARGTDYSAIQLFIQSAQRVQPTFAPQGGDVEAIAQICRLVAGMPLGILLAAAWAEMLAPGEIAAEIEGSFDFLEADLRDLPEHQRSLRAVFAQTWRRLSEAERDTFMQLSVFRGGFTREAAQAVTGASLRTLAALVYKALLQGEPGGRYDIHELVRQYAEEQLAAAGQEETAREAHGAYYLDFLGQRQADLKGGRQLEALAEIEAEHENVHLAWRWAVEQGQLDRLDWAMESLGLFYHSQGRYLEGEVAYHLAGEKLAAVGDQPRILAKTLTWQSVFSQRLGYGDLAKHLLEQSLALLDRPELAGQDTRSEKAFALLYMGFLAWYADVEETRPLLEESLALYRAAGDRWGTAWVLQDLGRLMWSLEAYHEAKQFAAESLALRRAMGDRKGMADSLEVLTYLAINQGQLAEAERFAQEVYTIRRDIGDPARISRGLFLVGLTLLWRGQFVEAQTRFEQGWTIIKEVGDRHHLNTLNYHLADTSLHLGQYRQAHAWGQRSLATAKEIGLRSHRSEALMTLGQVKIVEGAYAEARHLLAQSITIRREIGHQIFLGLVLPSLGYTDRGLDNIPLAQQHLAEALGMVANSGNFFALVGALPLAALLAADRDEIERAVELYALASRYPHVANSRWYEAVAGRQIAAAAETLPLEVVAAAQERGRARDVEATVAELLAELEGRSSRGTLE